MPLLALFLLSGCKQSTRELEWHGAKVEVDLPRWFTPSGSMPIAASADGKYYAIYCPVGKDGRYEIRKWANDEVIYSDIVANAKALPIMFSRDDKQLILMSTKGVWSLDLDTKKQKLIYDGPFSIPLETRNFDHSLLYDPEARVLFSSSGKLFSGTSLGFDEQGRAWMKQGDGFACIDGEGHREFRRDRPVYLVKSQIQRRGSFRLLLKESEVHMESGEAYVSTVWLQHRDARLQAALVLATSDIEMAGFVPGRNEVFVVTARGSCVVPFSLVKGRSK